MRRELVLRLALAAAFAVGAVLAGVIYASVVRLDRASAGFLKGAGARGSLRAFRASDSPLNPSTYRASGIASLLLHTGRPAAAERSALRLTRAEPENALVWVLLTQIQLARHETAAARRSWSHSHRLDPHIPAPLPPPA